MSALANRPFVKMNGVGNEIVVVDMRKDAAPISAADARAAAQPAGAPYDQLMALYPPRTPGTDAFVRIYNNDGSEAGACGNGTRCIACHYAAALTYRDRQYLRPETVEWLHGMSRAYYRDLYALLDEGKRAGVFDFGDARVAAHSMGGVMGFMYTWHDPSRIDAEVLAVELSGAMMKIILPAAPASGAKRAS